LLQREIAILDGIDGKAHLLQPFLGRGTQTVLIFEQEEAHGDTS
jgi:hypothetical protein